MKTVSLQGLQLSSSQRRTMDQQNHVRSLMVPVLDDQVSQIIAALDIRKEQGMKPEKQWITISDTRGTVSIAEWMGY